MYTHIHIYIYIYIHTYIHIRVLWFPLSRALLLREYQNGLYVSFIIQYIYIYIHIYMYITMCIYIYIYIYICVCMYTCVLWFALSRALLLREYQNGLYVRYIRCVYICIPIARVPKRNLCASVMYMYMYTYTYIHNYAYIYI